jgi:hypothetical protein
MRRAFPLITFLCLSWTANASLAAPPSAQAGGSAPPAAGSTGATSTTGATPDGLNVQLAMLTPVASGAAGSNNTSATPGVEFTYKKEFAPDGTPNADYSLVTQPGFSISSNGKAAFNTSTNVGDLLDFTGSGFYRIFFPGSADEWRGYVAANGNLSIAASQKFTTVQNLFGASIVGHFAGPDSLPASEFLDVFDWPGKLTRLAFGETWQQAQRNWGDASWPIFTVGFDRVKPQSDTARKMVDPGLSDYDRMHYAAAFSSKWGEFDSRIIVFSAKLDDWEEISPSQAISKAKLNHAFYQEYGLRWQSSSTPGSGWQLTYGQGSVPTDQAKSKTWQVGYNFAFQ